MARNSSIVVAIVAAAFLLGVAAGASTPVMEIGERVLFKTLDDCGYTRHGISDMAWVYYNKGIIPAGSARYYTHMMSSSNHGAVGACIKEEIG